MRAKAYLRPPASTGDANINVRYTHRHTYFAVKTGQSVRPELFDLVTGTVKRSHPEHTLINSHLDTIKSKLMQAARTLLLAGVDPTVDEVKAVYNGSKTVKQPAHGAAPRLIIPTREVLEDEAAKPKRGRPAGSVNKVKPSVPAPDRFNELLNLYGKGGVHDVSSTKKDKVIFQRVLREFEQWHGEKLSFAKMDSALYGRMAEYFLNVRGGWNNIFGKRIKETKAFLRWAEVEHGQQVHQGYHKWKVYVEEKEIVYLTPAEIDLLTTADLPPHLDKYRDVFVFSCLTGFRWSDIERTRLMVVQNGLLTITTQKNRGAAKVPVTPRVQALLNRYNGDLNIVTPQKLNESIKELCRRIGMDRPVRYFRYKLKEAFAFEAPKYELVSIHCGRRSFITNAFAAGFSVPEILDMIGSSDPKVLLGYLAITDHHLVTKTKLLGGS